MNRYRIVGAIALVWGGALLLSRLLGFSRVEGEGAYAAGQYAGPIFGVLLFIAGLYAVMKPLGERIKEFENKVEETYDKESKQRFSLEKEIANLRDLNTRIGLGPKSIGAHTRTSVAPSSFERNEMSGLVKGREYELQVSLTAEDGKRSRPDAVVYLPDERHIVIDSKVNLNAYERFYSMGEGPERDAELKLHIAAFRKHVDELSVRRYQDHYKLNSLDFV